MSRDDMQAADWVKTILCILIPAWRPTMRAAVKTAEGIAVAVGASILILVKAGSET
jgi:hypothetical protein